MCLLFVHRNSEKKSVCVWVSWVRVCISTADLRSQHMYKCIVYGMSVCVVAGRKNANSLLIVKSGFFAFIIHYSQFITLCSSTIIIVLLFQTSALQTFQFTSSPSLSRARALSVGWYSVFILVLFCCC